MPAHPATNVAASTAANDASDLQRNLFMSWTRASAPEATHRRGNYPNHRAGWSGTCRHWPSRRIPRRAEPWPSQRGPQAGLDEKLSCAEIAAAAVVILVAAVIGNSGTAGEQHHHDQHDNPRQRLEKNRLHALDMAPTYSGFNRPDFTSSLTPAS